MKQRINKLLRSDATLYVLLAASTALVAMPIVGFICYHLAY